MFRFLFLFILALHCLIHLIGFFNAWKLYTVKGFSGFTGLALSETGVKVAGVLWFVSCILFVLASLTYGLHKEWWWAVAFGAILLSQLLIFLYWKDVKAGTIVNIVILIVAIGAAANG